MKMPIVQSLKLALLLFSGSVLLWDLYSTDRAYGRAAISDLSILVKPPQTSQRQSLFAKPVFSLLPQAIGSQSDHIQAKQISAPEQEARVNLCVDLPDWQRPSEQTQRKQLEQMERYDGFLQEETLESLVKDWWTYEAFSFTTYGLSARTDPHYLSGIWTALEHIWGCYEGEEPEQINNGDLAELWLINHQLVDLQWQNNQYVVTVEPSTRGLQMLMFERRENYETLPVVIVTADGQEVASMSGDW